MRTLALSSVALSFAIAFTPLASYAQAAVPVVAVADSGIAPLPLDIQSSNGVTYVNGGISDEELAELKSRAKDFNLHVMLSAPAGEYISDVSLRVVDAKGQELISISDAGPYFYAHLQPGSYTLETSQNGDAVPKKVKVNITAKGIVSQHFVYKQ